MQNEVELYTKEQISDMICTAYGGRASEELFLGTITTGARDDIEKATRLAKHFIGSFGMSPEFGNVCLLNGSSDSWEVEKKMLCSSSSSRVFF